MQLEQLFQIEEAYEKAFQHILSNSKLDAFRSREKRDAQTPWVEVKFLVGTATEKRRRPLANGVLVYTGWLGSQLEITATTHRQNNGEQHRTMLGKIRLQCQLFKLLDTWPATEAATGHAIADIREGGSVSTFDSENDLDSTTITFRLSHNLRDDAFPIGI